MHYLSQIIINLVFFKKSKKENGYINIIISKILEAMMYDINFLSKKIFSGCCVIGLSSRLSDR